MASHPWLRGGPPARPAQATRAVRLQQVYSPPENQSRTDIDIIAIHGLDTNSEETWVWDPKGDNVNWLKQSDMLPEKFPSARIFTCDWPADLFEEPDFVQKEFEEFARLLLTGIKSRSVATDAGFGKAEERPIVFIASCLGGVILMKALVMASHEYQCVRQATRGIVFLATPFRGTSFQDVARWAEPGLNAWASLRGKKISNLLELVKSSFNLGELVRSFTALCQEHDLADRIVSFYETGKSSLPRKVAPWLPQYLAQEKPLVDICSATPDIVKHPLPLDRPHVLMNKFSGPHDPDYEIVAERIDYLLRKIRKGRAIERADAWIQTKRYSLKELHIERLSGEVLPMDRCYINLALVEQSAVSASRAEEDDAGQKASPFSLFARLKTERPDKTIEVTLPALFEPRQARDGQRRRPNRILIHGRAGVGKTTLCKKIVHDFTHSGMWKGLFDRVLWLPLRNLKREERRSSTYNFRSLFHDEYFSQHPKGEDFAEALWDTLMRSDKSLFILDGLDEVAQVLDGSMLVCFKELLDQPNVIITSRPHAMLPHDIKDFDLRLETIGFYPDQLKAYVENAFTDPETGQTNNEKLSMIQSYLQEHPLVQGLVRIPVQLDAFCFTWETWERSDDQDTPKTMTAVFRAIELSLWKKDAVKLGKLTGARALGARRLEITSLIKDQRDLLEYLAFTGIYNNMIDFESKHCDAILDGPTFTGKYFLLDETLKCLSFLRTSDQSLGSRDQSYHFLHLTFQEYFAARYFVQQWKANKPLEYITFGSTRNRGSKPDNLDPIAFIQREKYKSRYDIFWRFVAGLLNEEGGDEEASRFFDAIEAEPLDLLGPAHQRLVMHCLSEIRTEVTFREDLEERLYQWLLFECKYTYGSSLATEMEFPVSALVRALRASSRDIQITVLRALEKRPGIESDVLDLIASLLEDERSYGDESLSVLHVLEHGAENLSYRAIRIIADQLEGAFFRQTALRTLAAQSLLTLYMPAEAALYGYSQDWRVIEAAVRALAVQSALTPDMLERATAQRAGARRLVQAARDALADQSALMPESPEQVAAELEDEDPESYTIEAPTGPSAPTLEGLEEVTALLPKSRNKGFEMTALKVLASQPEITPEILENAIALLPDIKKDIRLTALQVLASQLALTLEDIEKATALLPDPNEDIRLAPLELLAGQSALTPEVPEQATALLTDANENVRLAALEVLASQAELTPETFEKVAARLSDNDMKVLSTGLC
ncbi:hypothetical protein HFD88_003250 [Aspergillus terreus]|nr:hypothetical protein HFD88_003250 [Aspergillus terreus]